MSTQIKHDNAGDKVSKTFCIMPWVHLHTWPNGNVFPCCLADSDYPLGNMKDNSLEEIWNSDNLKGIRKEMLDGKEPSVCHRCFMQEKVGSGSFRVSSNNQWEHRIDRAIKTTDVDGHSNHFELNYWDFRFSNVCNLKCRMCGPELSSKWYDDQIKFYGSSTTSRALIHANDVSKVDINKYVDDFIDVVEEIYFAGGEPLLMDEHYRILEKLIEVGNTNCRIRYNTNFSKLKFKGWDTIELWKKFTDINKDNVRIFASLDAIGPQAEYARKGTNWSIIEKNIKTVLGHKLNFFTSTTTSILNIFEIPKFVDRMIELGVPVKNMQMNNVLTFPDYYGINILPDELKEQVVELLDKHLSKFNSPLGGNSEEYGHLKSNYDVFKTYLYMEPGRDINSLRADFKKFTNIKDRGREESLIETYPYYKDWFETL